MMCSLAELSRIRTALGQVDDHYQSIKHMIIVITQSMLSDYMKKLNSLCIGTL